MPHELLAKLLPSMAEASKLLGTNVTCKLSKQESEQCQTFLREFKTLTGVSYETTITPLGLKIVATKGVHDESNS